MAVSSHGDFKGGVDYSDAAASGAARPPRRIGLLWGLVALFLVAAMGVLAGGYWLYHLQEGRLRQSAENELQAIARLKANQIVEWRRERLGDAHLLMGSPFLVRAIASWLADPDAQTGMDILSQFRALQEVYQYRDILLLDPEGRVRLSLSGLNPQLHKEMIAVLASALREQRPMLTDLHLGSDDEVPHMGVVTPLFAPGSGETKPIGAILLYMDAREFLFPLIRSWPTLSASAETLLIRQENGTVRFLNDLRHRPDTALKLQIPLSQHSLPAVMAVVGKRGLVQGMDYRGVEVLATLRSIPESNWLMVTKVDKAEVFSALRARSVLIGALMVALLATAAALVAFVWQRTQRAHYLELFRAESARRMSMERYHQALDSMMEGCQIVDFDWRYVYVNDALTRHGRKGRDELLGHTMMELYPGIENTEVFALLQTCMRDRTSGQMENKFVYPDGDPAWFDLSVQPVPEGLFILSIDVTEHKRAEEALRDSESRYRDLFNSMFDGFIVGETISNEKGHAVDGRIVSVNPAFERLTGLKADQVQGKRVFELWPNLEQYRVGGDRIALTAAPIRFEQSAPRLGKHFEIYAFRSQVGQFACLIRDITERKQAEEAKKRLEAQLLQAAKMEAVGRLAGGVAHDFNNMLSVILGYTETALLTLKPEDPLYEDLQEILKATTRSADLTQQLLAFSRQQTIAPRTININAEMRDMDRMLRRIIGEDVDLEFRLAPGLWPVLIDPTQLNQIVANLAVNARDAMPDGGRLLLETRNTTLDEAYCRDHVGFQPGDFVLLEVGDSGVGMDQETLEHVFEPFFTTKEQGRGTGLGLATVYGVVKQNNGFINVYSESGQGTAIRIYLPRAAAGQEASEAAVTRKPFSGGGETILLAEDDASLRQLIRTMLEGLGYTVEDVEEPDKAIDLCERYDGEIHLLVTDVVMPGMNGRELEDKIKVLRPKIKTLFISGYTADLIVHRGVLLGDVHFLQKPFSRQDLAQKVREALDGE